jgi:pyrimidine operon attenuation protein/uracil phosphoribosyltransferase
MVVAVLVVLLAVRILELIASWLEVKAEHLEVRPYRADVRRTATLECRATLRGIGGVDRKEVAILDEVAGRKVVTCPNVVGCTARRASARSDSERAHKASG